MHPQFKKSYDLLLNLRLKVYHIDEYRILENDNHV